LQQSAGVDFVLLLSTALDSINQSTNQSINQSINWFICMAAKSSVDSLVSNS